MESCTSGSARYLIVKAKGGMGNRMLCAVTGILYGRITGRATIVDWRDITYSNDGSNSFARFFLNPHVLPESALPPNATIRPRVWEGQLNKPMKWMLDEYDPHKHSSIRIHRKYSIDIRYLDYEEEILVFWCYTHRIRPLSCHLRDPAFGYAGLTIRQIIRKAIRDELILQDPIRRRVSDFKASYWKPPVIGVHIRHTDRRTDLRRYERAVRQCLSRSPHAQIFLATDNREVSEHYHLLFDNVISTPKWFPQGFSSMHQNEECPDKVANGIEALVDMYLLAECDYLIYPGGSTFSWISCLLSNALPENTFNMERFDLIVRAKSLIRTLLE